MGVETGTAGGAPKRTRHTDETPFHRKLQATALFFMNQGLAGITVIFTITIHGSRYPSMVINTLAVEAVFADLVTEQPQAMRLQRQCIQAALARHGGNRAGAARELDIDASNLHKLARRLALKDWLLKT